MRGGVDAVVAREAPAAFEKRVGRRVVAPGGARQQRAYVDELARDRVAQAVHRLRKAGSWANCCDFIQRASDARVVRGGHPVRLVGARRACERIVVRARTVVARRTLRGGHAKCVGRILVQQPAPVVNEHARHVVHGEILDAELDFHLLSASRAQDKKQHKKPHMFALFASDASNIRWRHRSGTSPPPASKSGPGRLEVTTSPPLARGPPVFCKFNLRALIHGLTPCFGPGRLELPTSPPLSRGPPVFCKFLLR